MKGGITSGFTLSLPYVSWPERIGFAISGGNEE